MPHSSSRSIAALPGPGHIGIPRFATGRSGRCSRPSGRALCPMPAVSMAFTRFRLQSRRPASCASTTTATRWRRAPLAGRLRSAPMPSGSSSGRVSLVAPLVRATVANRVVGEHARAFGRGETVYDPWHYVPVLARKPGALRIEPLSAIGPRTMAKGTLQGLGAARLPRACAPETAQGSGRRPADGRDPRCRAERRPARRWRPPAPRRSARASIPPASFSTSWRAGEIRTRRSPSWPQTRSRLAHEPAADCARYDNLRRAI